MNILAFFAHPDDETMLAGGALALLAQNGAQVHYLCATRGEGGEVLRNGFAPARDSKMFPVRREGKPRYRCRCLADIGAVPPGSVEQAHLHRGPNLGGSPAQPPIPNIYGMAQTRAASRAADVQTAVPPSLNRSDELVHRLARDLCTPEVELLEVGEVGQR